MGGNEREERGGAYEGWGEVKGVNGEGEALKGIGCDGERLKGMGGERRGARALGMTGQRRVFRVGGKEQRNKKGKK